MWVELLGTGRAGDAVPRPECACPLCRATKSPRRPTSGLVAGRLLVDDERSPQELGPIAGGGVVTRLFTTPEPGRDVLWPGDRRDVAGLQVLALAAGDAAGEPRSGHIVLLVRDESGTTLLWAPATGPLPQQTLDGLKGVGIDIAVLGIPGPDLASLGHQVARLRGVRALGRGARVVAVELGHELPPQDRLPGLVEPWGVELADDGALVTDRATGTDRADPHAVRRTLVLGGAASGKSAWAEHLLAAEPYVTYLATGREPDPDDLDWTARVQAHRARRPAWWTTVEGAGAKDLPERLLDATEPLLWDSVGTWLTAVLDDVGAWEEEAGWRSAADEAMDDVVAAWQQVRPRAVAVVEDVSGGVVPETRSGRLLRALLGELTQRLADVSDDVTLVVAGRRTELA